MRLRNNPNALNICKDSKYFQELDKLKQSEFLTRNNLCLEIGSGKGKFLWETAKMYPDKNFVGLEKFVTVIAKATGRYAKQEEQLNNILLTMGDANDVLDIFAPHSVQKIYLNFSDPWPKKRHAKRRLIDLGFLQKYEQILSKTGDIEFKTDNDDLFAYCLEQIQLKNNVAIIDQTWDLHSHENNHMLLKNNVCTEYETKFLERNIKIKKIIFKFC